MAFIVYDLGVFPLLGTAHEIAATAVFLCGPGDFVRDLETASRDRGYSHIADESRGAWYLRQLRGSSNLPGDWWFKKDQALLA